MRPTSMALAVGAMVLLAVGGCSRTLGDLIYNDSLLCGDQDQACAPDGGRFDLHIVDRTTLEVANPSVPTFDMVAKPNSTVVGFAYLVKSPRQDSGVIAMFPDAGLVDYDIMFREFDVDAGVASAPQLVQTVQRFFGVSVAYQVNGFPAVAYLGGPPDFTQAFWYQNDAAIAYNQGGRWVEQVAAANSSPPVANSAPSDQGDIVGFFPALIFQGNNAVLAYRDGHNGSSIGAGDWNAADLEMAIGGPTSWSPVALLQSGDSKRGYGGHSRIIYGAKTLSSGLRAAALISDRVPSGPDTFGQDIEFSEQQSDGSWGSAGAVQPLTRTGVDSPSILGANGASILPNTQAGPSIDYRDTFGYAVAVTDRSQNGALFTACAVNSDCLQPGNWDTLDPVFQRGTGGWYAAVAISPAGDPSVAYYVCSKQPNRNENSCTPDHYLAVANQGPSKVWSDHEVVVDNGAVFQTRMVFMGTKRVIGYRNGASGVLQIAVEKQ